MQRIFLLFIIAGLTWMVGFAAFISKLPAAETNRVEAADAVIVYTGGRGGRIVAGMSIFADGAGERMLISGVHKDTSRERLFELWGGPEDRFSCCVDIGREARSTIGNAVEAGAWIKANEFNSAILVTSEYHMPRAIVESRAKMPGVNIIPYVVASDYLNAEGRPQSSEAWWRLAREYTKYLAARVKAFAPGIGS
ncbi:MAG: YdcF family protein [Marinicaulis sp.]|nr:YdcF family protein [Marinicaulis sp.]